MKKKAAKQPAKDETSFASVNELEVAFSRSPGKGWENLDCKLTHIHNYWLQNWPIIINSKYLPKKQA